MYLDAMTNKFKNLCRLAKRRVGLFLLVLSTALMAFGQQQVVKGTVKDASGEPAVGATILLKGTQTGVITDIDGNFSIQVADVGKAVLTISYIGYETQEVALNGKTSVQVTLQESSEMLEEVQIVAYGVQKKETLTGAISSVDTEELLVSPNASVANSLAGKITGLSSVQSSGQPGAEDPKIFVRGVGSLTEGGASPLILVDGVERSFFQMDPNEIENISVLKDASATAVFGVRGANGVILVTTRRGEEGKTKISLSSSVGIQQVANWVDLADSYTYAMMYNEREINDGGEAVFDQYALDRFRLHDQPIVYPDVDWYDYMVKDAAVQTQHNLNISGGTDRVRYFISAGAYTQGGLFEEFNLPYHLDYRYKRFNYRSNLDIDVTKTTTLSMNVAGNVNNATKPYTGQGSAGMLINMYYATPFSSPGIVGGRLVNTTTDYAEDPLPFTGGNGMSYYGNGFMQTNNNTLNADLQLKQNLDFVTKGLSFHLKGSYNSGFTSYTRATASVATYTPVLMDDGSISYKKIGMDSQLDYQDVDPAKSRDWYMEAAFNYARDFGDHHVTALALYNQSKE